MPEAFNASPVWPTVRSHALGRPKFLIRPQLLTRGTPLPLGRDILRLDLIGSLALGALDAVPPRWSTPASLGP